jgi:hypothetical protein
VKPSKRLAQAFGLFNNDYGTKEHSDINKLNRAVDDLKLGALANLEELYQLLDKNYALTDHYGWGVSQKLRILRTLIETLKKEI